jgi:uncharacterized membrane protein YdbT with pleckstrin-like domain
MSYVNDNLLPDEIVRFRGVVHWIIFLNPLMISLAGAAVLLWMNQLIIAGFLFLFALWSFAKAMIYFFTTELAVTNRRVIAKFGLIQRVTFELNLDRVMSLNVQQTVLGRILNYGDIFVNGIGGVSTPIPVIEEPLRFRQWVLGEAQVAAR